MRAVSSWRLVTSKAVQASSRLGVGSNSFVSAVNARRLGSAPKAPSLAEWLNALSRD